MTQEQIKAKVNEKAHVMTSLFARIVNNPEYNQQDWDRYCKAGIRKSELEAQLTMS